MRFFRLLLIAFVALGMSPVPAAAAAGEWSKPVSGGVVRGFEPPRTRFGVGHVGVDFVAAPGTPVHAANAGTVTFAGQVGGVLHVVIAHDGDLRTSYSFLAEVGVRRGAKVARGAVVGTSGGMGANHGGGVVHFGLRQGETYLDPMVLFREIDLAEVVHLAPVSDPLFRTESDESRGLLDGLGNTVASVGGFLDDAAGALTSVAEPLAGFLVRAGERPMTRLRELVEMHPLVSKTLTALAIARGTVQYVREQFNCDRNAAAADGTGGSGHRVMLVAGINTQLDRPDGQAMGLDAERLGYAPDEITTFSYAAGPTYERVDTLDPIIESAYALAEQLKQMQRDEPGREVDLIGHSQGGVVVLTFLELVYEPGDAAYPPLGTVVTFASPLDGAPLATTVARLRNTPSGRILTEVADATGLAPPSDAGAAQDLAEGSDLMDRLADAHAPGTVDLTTIGGSTDLVVPGNRATTDGARHIVVSPLAPGEHNLTDVLANVVHSHTELLDDADALRTARSALEARDHLPCRDLWTFIEAEILPPTIEEYTYGLADLNEIHDPLSPLPWP